MVGNLPKCDCREKGEVDSVVYIVCHYDKIDGNIISLVNLFINGSLDIILSNTFLSQGGYDNGTGVVSSLALMHWINDKPMHYTYRFLFAGMEEYGLRGSRRHVSSLSLKEWSKCVYAINIDMIAGKGINGVTMTEDVSHAVLKNLARHTSARTGIVMQEAQPPGHASSDFHSFKGQSFKKDFAVSFSSNFVGALIPQRSYFTKVKAGIPVINFTDDIRLNVAESFSIFLLYHSGRYTVCMINVQGLASTTWSSTQRSFSHSLRQSMIEKLTLNN